MNERIRELAEQCYNLPDIPDALFYRKFDEEKFAELIVRECANLDFSDVDYISIEGEDQVRKIIKEHFGVKNETR